MTRKKCDTFPTPSLEEREKRGKRKKKRGKKGRKSHVILKWLYIQTSKNRARSTRRDSGSTRKVKRHPPPDRRLDIQDFSSVVMSMSPWKGWSVNGRSDRTDGEASPQRERSGDADESPNPGPFQATGYVSPVAWQVWNAGLPEPAAVEPTSWVGWSNGQEVAVVPAQATLVDKRLGNPPRTAPLAAVVAAKVGAPVGASSPYEAAPMTDQRGTLGKRAGLRDNAPPPLKVSLSVTEAVTRARAERRFTRGDYTAALKVAKANGEKVGSLEIDGEGFTEAVDKFALALTNKDYQMALGMSTEVFYGMDTDNRLKTMRNKITSERLSALGVDRLRCAYVAV